MIRCRLVADLSGPVDADTVEVLLQAAVPDFAPIVVEFARLQKEIEGKRWALVELGGAAPPAL